MPFIYVCLILVGRVRIKAGAVKTEHQVPWLAPSRFMPIPRKSCTLLKPSSYSPPSPVSCHHRIVSNRSEGTGGYFHNTWRCFSLANRRSACKHNIQKAFVSPSSPPPHLWSVVQGRAFHVPSIKSHPNPTLNTLSTAVKSFIYFFTLMARVEHTTVGVKRFCTLKCLFPLWQSVKAMNFSTQLSVGRQGKRQKNSVVWKGQKSSAFGRSGFEIDYSISPLAWGSSTDQANKWITEFVVPESWPALPTSLKTPNLTRPLIFFSLLICLYTNPL